MVIDVNPEGLNGTGKSVSNKSVDAGSSVNRLHSGLSFTRLGGGGVDGALQAFVTDNVDQPKATLAHNITAAGRHLSNTAAVTVNSDTQASQVVGAQANDNEAHSGLITSKIISL